MDGVGDRHPAGAADIGVAFAGKLRPIKPGSRFGWSNVGRDNRASAACFITDKFRRHHVAFPKRDVRQSSRSFPDVEWRKTSLPLPGCARGPVYSRGGDEIPFELGAWCLQVMMPRRASCLQTW